MNIQQIFDLYAAQDVQFANTASIIRKHTNTGFNANSITFFVHHFLEEYEQPSEQVPFTHNDLERKQSDSEGDSIFQLDPLNDVAIKVNTLMDVIYDSKASNRDAHALTNQICQVLKHLKETPIHPQKDQILTQINECLRRIDANNELLIDQRILVYFALNLAHKLSMYDISFLDNQVVMQLLLLRKQLKLVFKDRQFNYAYVNSHFFAKQNQLIQIQNNLKKKEKQNYFTYIACPKCKQKKCIQQGERQTTLGGDEMSRIVLLCKNPECLHKFKR